MPAVTVTCDRCKKEVEGIELNHKLEVATLVGTAGFYRLEPDRFWGRFAKEGETVICDACMFKDPHYRRFYPQSGQLTVTFEELHEIFLLAETLTAAQFDGRTCSLLNKDGRHECPICYFSGEVHKALAAADPDVPRPKFDCVSGR